MDILTLLDAQKIAGPRSFNLMIKPAGSLCNLDCRYCYYLDKASIYDNREPRMSSEILENTIRKYMEANEAPEVTFNWHGGEPLVMGLDFYRNAVRLEKQYADGRIIHNTIQTNGTLLTSDWAAFLRDNDFLVGISVDGPSFIHDQYRCDRNGGRTLERVMRGVELLGRAGVEYNTMTTINRLSEGHGLEVYKFMQSLGSRYMQFMPVFEHVSNGASPHIVSPSEDGTAVAPWSVTPSGFGRFLIDIFDWWVRKDVGRYFVNIFDATLAGWAGVAPGTCVYAETCGVNSVIEHNGDVYVCDHFVYPRYKLGNITTDSLALMMDSERQLRFGIDKRNALPGQCLRCEWLKACHGECPKHRFCRTESGEPGLNALCDGYRMFFSHVAPYMDFMLSRLVEGNSPAEVMRWAQTRTI